MEVKEVMYGSGSYGRRSGREWKNGDDAVPSSLPTSAASASSSSYSFSPASGGGGAVVLLEEIVGRRKSKSFRMDYSVTL